MTSYPLRCGFPSWVGRAPYGSQCWAWLWRWWIPLTPSALHSPAISKEHITQMKEKYVYWLQLFTAVPSVPAECSSQLRADLWEAWRAQALWPPASSSLEEWRCRSLAAVGPWTGAPATATKTCLVTPCCSEVQQWRVFTSLPLLVSCPPTSSPSVPSFLVPFLQMRMDRPLHGGSVVAGVGMGGQNEGPRKPFCVEAV